MRYYWPSQAILNLFVDDDSGDLAITTLPCTLARLSNKTDVNPEDARQATLVLLAEGDFTAIRLGRPVDIERVDIHQRFDLVVDPILFESSRFSIRTEQPAEQPAV